MRYLLIITLFFMSCDAPKNNFGYVRIDDEKSRNIVELFEAVEDEDIEFLKIHPDNDTLANFYSELLLILRFIRNKEANTIGR